MAEPFRLPKDEPLLNLASNARVGHANRGRD